MAPPSKKQQRDRDAAQDVKTPRKKRSDAKWVLLPNPPPHPTQDLPLAYTTFAVAPLINVKNQTSSYLKSEGQTWLARAAAAPFKKRRLDPSLANDTNNASAKGKAAAHDTESGDGDDDDLESEDAAKEQQANTIIIHPGSQYLRIGRATDLFPVSVPNVIARKERPTPYEVSRRAGQGHAVNGRMQESRGTSSGTANGASEPVASTSNAGKAGSAEVHDTANGDEGEPDTSQRKDPLTEKIDVLRLELRSIMRTNKLRPVTNGRALTSQYNEGVKPEAISEHNDVYKSDWTDGESPPEKSIYVGEAALQLPDFSIPAAQEAAHEAALAASWNEPRWRLFRPFKRGLLNHDAYAEVYGPETGLQALLNDVEAIWAHALTAAPEDPTQPSASGTVDYGLGIPRHDWPKCSVILVVPDLFSRADVRALIELVLGPMGFAAVLVQTEGVAATFGAGVSSACIVDIGLERIGISCVEEGLVLPETRIALDYGGADLTTFFEALLHRSNMPYRELNGSKRITDTILVESLKERLCTLNPADLGLNNTDFLLTLPRQPTLKYMLRTYDEVILAPMALFMPRVIDFEAKSGWRVVEASGGRAGADEGEEASVVLGVPAGAELLRDVEPVVTLAMQHCCRHLLPPPAPAPAPAPVVVSDAAATAANSNGGTGWAANANGMATPGTAAASRSGTPGVAVSSPAVERFFQLGAANQGGGAASSTTSTSVATGANAPASAVTVAPRPMDIVREASKMPLDVAVWASIVASGSSMGAQLTSVGINTVGGGAGEERIKKMSSNVIVTGGTAQIPGLGIALELRVNQHFGDWLARTIAAAQASAEAQSQATGGGQAPTATTTTASSTASTTTTTTPAWGAGAWTATVPSANLQPRTTVVPPARDIDPRVLPWKGMSVLARLECVSDLWLHAADWDALGWRAAKDKILFL